MSININGLTYYKLDYNIHGYPGDITKNCGLRGEEIDGNFHFLRGHDVKNISFDVNNNLIIERYNGDKLIAPKTELPDYDFKYNSESGVLTIITSNGNEINVGGFKIDNVVYHDYTIDGDGSKLSPLKISNIYKTGRHLPAIKLIDKTNNETLPSKENLRKYDRFVTKENINNFGLLYPINSIEVISNYLKEINSEWHIPSKEEWDELLNVVDCGTPNHNSSETGELGEFAGTILKSRNYWEPFNNKVLNEDAYGFSILPVGYYNNEYLDFGKSTAFWTSTKSENGNIVKLFSYDKETVGQHISNGNDCFSIRLVKKFVGNNFSDVEYIDGVLYDCIHIPGTSLIWTKENVSFSQEVFNGIDVINEDGVNNFITTYFINEWNGADWDKIQIREGESIVLKESYHGRMHEWIIVDNELIDSAIFHNNEFNKELTEVKTLINTESQNRINQDNILTKNIDSEIQRATAKENTLEDLINQNNEITSSAIKELNDNINSEIQRATSEEQNIKDILNNVENIYHGENAIDVTKSIENNTKTISLKINNNDNILINDSNGLLANLNLKWVKENQKEEIQLIGKNNIIISKIDVSEFIKDGILESVTLSEPIEGETGNKYFQFIFNAASGKETIRLDVSELIKTYYAGQGLSNINNVFSILIDSNSEKYLSVGTNGLKLNGITDEINIHKEYIIQLLNSEVNNLKEQIKQLQDEIVQLKKSVITNIKGVDNEISVSVTDNTATVGFADDAYFVAG